MTSTWSRRELYNSLEKTVFDKVGRIHDAKKSTVERNAVKYMIGKKKFPFSLPSISRQEQYRGSMRWKVGLGNRLLNYYGLWVC